MRRAVVIALVLSVVPLASLSRCRCCGGCGWSVVSAMFGMNCDWSCRCCDGSGRCVRELLVPPKREVDDFGDAI